MLALWQVPWGQGQAAQILGTLSIHNSEFAERLQYCMVTVHRLSEL